MGEGEPKVGEDEPKVEECEQKVGEGEQKWERGPKVMVITSIILYKICPCFEVLK